MASADRRVRDYPFSVPEGLTVDQTFAQLREQEPVSRVRMPFGGEAWLVTRHADVKAVLTDPRLSRAATVGQDCPRPMAAPPQPGMLTTMDGPEHARLRKLAASAFTARRIEAFRPRIAALANSLVDELIAHGPPADLCALVARPMPLTVIREILGVPEQDQQVIHHFADILLTLDQHPFEDLKRAWTEFCGYVAGLISQRRAEPAEDLLSVMVHARDADDQLAEAELVQLAVSLLVAGFETTACQISNFAYLLLQDRSRFEWLAADPGRIPRAVEELMRFVPFRGAAENPAIALEDMEIAGTRISAGDTVIVSLTSANRDGSLVADADRLDLGRDPVAHLGFNHGAHFCLGANLARVELQETLRALVVRLPGLRFAVAERELSWKRGVIFRQLGELPVAW